MAEALLDLSGKEWCHIKLHFTLNALLANTHMSNPKYSGYDVYTIMIISNRNELNIMTFALMFYNNYLI